MNRSNTLHRPVDLSDRPIARSKLIQLRGDRITGDRYYSTDFAKTEWEHMWTRVWLIGGRESELVEPGDFIVHTLVRESVLIVKQEDGSIRSFYNTCGHRGNRLVWHGAGAVSNSFHCAYHGWQWGLNGVLLEARDREDFPQGDPCGKLKLVELKCEVWGGFVWYSMDPKAKPLAEYLGSVPKQMANRNLDEMVRVVWRKIKVNTNWKFSADNFNESYHLPTVHPQMVAYIDETYWNTVFEMDPSGHNRMIQHSQPSGRSTQGNEHEVIWNAMLSDWALNPLDYVDRPDESRIALQTNRRQLGPQRGYRHYARMQDDELTDSYHHTLFPNMTLTGVPDGLHFFRTEPHPTDPEWCTFEYWYLASPVAGLAEVPTVCGLRPLQDAMLEELTYGVDSMGDFVDQDLSVAVAQQQAFHSRGYTGAYLSNQEARVQRFHEVLNDYLEGRR